MIRAVFFGLGLSAASCANAQLPAVSPDAAVAAAGDCAEAASAGRVDVGKLEARGWQAATMRSEGRTVEMPLQIFGKSGASPVLMISPSRDGSPEGCVLTGALGRLSDFNELEAAFTRQFEAAGKKADDRYFRIGSDMVVLTPTGSRSKPSFRVAVLELGVSK